MQGPAWLYLRPHFWWQLNAPLTFTYMQVLSERHCVALLAEHEVLQVVPKSVQPLSARHWV